MKINTLIFSIFFVASNQSGMFKIQINEGLSDIIQYEDLSITTNLHVYDETAASHLTGDISLTVNDNDRPLADFYIHNNKSAKEYYTRLYKKYFLTFHVDSGRYSLIIQHARFGKAFALSDKGSLIVENEEKLEIEIIDYQHERGYDAPIENGERKRWEDVEYTIKVRAKDFEEYFSFYSSELKGGYNIDVGNYNITVLSDLYGNKNCLVEMMVNIDVENEHSD